MSIVYLLGEFPSKTEYFILNEIIELQKRGLEIIVFAVRKGPPIGEQVKKIEGKVVYCNRIISASSFIAHIYLISSFRKNYFRTLNDIISTSKLSLFTFLKELKKLTIAAQFLYKLRKSNENHLHAHFVSFPASIALRMSQLSGIPFSCSAHAHDIYTSDKLEIIRKLNAAKFLVTCTAFNQQYLYSFIESRQKKKIFHLYHGIRLSQWPQKPQVSFNEKKIKILAIGRLVEKKGFIFLLKAVKSLKERGYSLTCSIIGDGPLREEFEDYILINNLTRVIFLHGALEQNAVKAFYQKTDIFVLPCIISADGDRDGLPNVLVEALAVGIPVISTPVSAIPELIVDGETGILVPEKDPESITKAVACLVNAPNFRNFLITNGRKKVGQEFSIDASTDRLVQLFHPSTKMYEKKTQA